MLPPRIVPIAAALLAFGLAACGGGPPSEPQPAKGPAKGPAAERAFLSAMVPHHRSAVDMAAVAEREAETTFVRELADEITAAQAREIAQMEKIHRRLFRAPLKPDMAGHTALGLSAREAGMDHMDGAAMLRGKRPFDRAFVDGMVPHHEGATRMAEAVLAQSRDRELRRLAEDIVSAQRKEIAEMQDFRRREYGGPVPEAAPGTHAG